ncbi:MAG: response regulator [Methanoregula sp.]|nr:response regulator [Methanoregula sp.]
MTAAAIFIVEDEAIVADDIRDSLQHLGYTVTGTAKSGDQALEKIGQTLPDLVLMDIHIAGPMDGIETAGRIRAKYHIPVVYLTAHSDTQLLERAKLTGPYGYIIKPFNDHDLQSSIEIALAKHQAYERVRETEHLIRSLVNTNTEPVFIVDNDTNVLFINDAFASTRPGMEPAQFKQKLERLAFADIISGRLVGAVLEHFFDKEPHRFIEEFQGKWIAHTIYPLTDTKNQIKRCAVHSYDITEIKHRELDLSTQIEHLANEKQSLMLFAAMIESMDDMVIATDMRGNILYVNKSFINRFGYTSAEVRKQPISILKDPSDPLAMDAGAFFIDEKKIWSGNFTGLNKYKMKIRILLKSSPVIFDNQVICRVFVLRERPGG